MGEESQSHSSKRYPCSRCDKRYKTERRLQRHFERRHVIPSEEEDHQEVPDEVDREEDEDEVLMKQVDEVFRRRLGGDVKEEVETDGEEDDQRYIELLCAAPYLLPTQKKKPDLEGFGRARGEEPEESHRVEVKRRRKRKGNLGWRDDDFECVFCGKVFKATNQFENHIRVHTREQPFECEWCGESFSRPNYLTKHVKLHVQPERFQCPICNQGFADIVKLKAHTRTHAKNYVSTCDQCGKTFSNQNKLDRHMLVHTGKKEFKCKTCRRSYYRSDLLKQHQQRAHNKMPSLHHQCEICKTRFSTWKQLDKHQKEFHPPPEKELSAIIPQEFHFEFLE